MDRKRGQLQTDDALTSNLGHQMRAGHGRLKDFRRIATRCDRSATNDLAAVCLAAIVTYWL